MQGGLTSMPGNVMERVILTEITKRVWENTGIGPSLPHVEVKHLVVFSLVHAFLARLESGWMA